MKEDIYVACSKQAEGKEQVDEVCSVCRRLLDPNEHTCKTLVPQVAIDAVHVIQALKADAIRFRTLCAILEAAHTAFPSPFETGGTKLLCSFVDQPDAESRGLGLCKALEQLTFEPSRSAA